MDFEIDFDLFEITILKNTMERLENEVETIDAKENIKRVLQKLEKQENRILNNK